MKKKKETQTFDAVQKKKKKHKRNLLFLFRIGIERSERNIKLKRMNEHIIIYVHNLKAIAKKGGN